MNGESDVRETAARPGEALYWAEFMCWTAVALIPLLYWVHGPAVSTDQFVVRIIVTTAALGGAVGLRAYKLICGRKRNTGTDR